MAIGFGVLRLSSHDFWLLTPREFAAALRALYGEPAAPIDRAALAALIARYPDHNLTSWPGLSPQVGFTRLAAS